MKNTLERSDKLGAFYIWLDYESDNFLESNTKFLDSINVPKRHRIYVSRYTPTVIVMLKENEKSALEALYEITPFLFERPEKMSDEFIIRNINADYVFNTDSVNDVKIGVIAAENIIFDSSAKSLEGLDIVVYDSIIPPRVDRHPTCVLSEIIGNKVSADGINFSGLARGARVYFDSLYTVNEIFDSIERMLDEGVRIINFSAGTNHDGIYSDFDRQIDRLIIKSDLLFVTAVGNYVKAASPAKAYNALSVGNAVTKSGAITPLSPPFKIAATSAYTINPNTPSKPEISAPGEWVGFVNSEGKGDFENFGTSFSTPLVTGVAGQILNLKNDLSYLSIKGLLLLSADESLIDEEDRFKSGYGLLDALGAIEALDGAIIIEGRLNGDFDYELDADRLFFIFELDEQKNYPRLFSDGDEVNFYPETSIRLKKKTKSVRVVGKGNCRFSLILL